MTYEFEYLFHLVSASAFGRTVRRPWKTIDWNELFRLAKEQNVFTDVVWAAKQLKKRDCDVQTWNCALEEYRTIVYSEIIRRDAIFDLFQRLRDFGIPFAILKGIGLSVLYAVPECRVCGDVDLYVGPENEERAQSVLKNFGVNVYARNPLCQEAKCTHKIIGNIELHAFLFNANDRRHWFTMNTEFIGITAPFTTVRDSLNRTIPVLDDYDNALFLSFHLAKHFIRGGISLRNIVDIALFFSKHKDCIDRSDLWDKLKELHLDRIIYAALNSCLYYGELEASILPTFEKLDKETIDMFMDDIEQGGSFGYKDIANRTDGAIKYEFQTHSQQQSYAAFSLRKKCKNVLEMLYIAFHCKGRLELKFPCLKQNPIVLPVVWLCYVSTGLIKVALKKHYLAINSSNTALPDREILFKKLGILR